MMNAAIESLVQKVQCGVVINFEKFGPDPPPIADKVENSENGNAKGKQFQITSVLIPYYNVFFRMKNLYDFFLKFYFSYRY